MAERPIKYCYWVESGKLLAGEYPGDIDDRKAQEKVDALLKAGVSVFIDLTEGERESKYISGTKLRLYTHLVAEKARHLPFPIVDGEVPKSAEFTKQVLDAIDQHIEEGHTVYVHCLGGVGRTGTIIGCWLARHNGYDGDAALERLRELWWENPKSCWRDSPENPRQKEYVRNWHE